MSTIDYKEVEDLARSIGAQTGLEDLGSDVSTWYPTGCRSLDRVLGGGCFTGDTKISLLDGTETKIKDLVGLEEFWVYSCKEDGTVVPGRGHSARITKYVKEILKVTLDNGEVIECTPDHRFMMRDGSYKEIKDIDTNESIMPLHFVDTSSTYPIIIDNKTGKSFVQRFDGTNSEIIGQEFKDRPESEILSTACDHKIISKESITLENEIPVYDITVDEYENFALSSGVFVHNCPSGKVIEIYGWEGTYKSTLALVLADSFDKHMRSIGKKHIKTFCEAESAFNKERTLYMGYNIDNFIVSESDSVESSFKFHTDAISKASTKDIATFCITDTIAALGTDNEVKKGEFCFTGDTVVKLLDGTYSTMEDLVRRYLEGEDLWVYSYDLEENEIVPGEIVWAGETKTVDEIAIVTLDNGYEIKCTVDHLFLTRDGKYVEAQDLKSRTSLMPLYYTSDDLGYETISSPENIMTHRMTGRFNHKGDPGSLHCHHNNKITNDNRPSNIDVITKGEHGRRHLIEYNKSAIARERLARRNSDPEFIKRLDATWTAERRASVSRRNERLAAAGEGQYHPDNIKRRNNLITDNKMFRRALKVIEEGRPLTEEEYGRGASRPSRVIASAIKRFGSIDTVYEKAKEFNHKVKSVRIVSAPNTKMYDITVPGTHNFVICAEEKTSETACTKGSGIFVHQSGGLMEKPRVLKRELREMVKLLGSSDTTLVLVNQVYSGGSYSEDVSPGGGGMRYYPSIRAKTRIEKEIKKVLPSGEEVIEYAVVEIFTRKNKLTTPGLKGKLVFSPDKGLDIPYTAYYNCDLNNLFTKSGSWKSFETEFGGEKISISFQNYDQLLEKASDIPGFSLLDYFHYLIDINYSHMSPLVKIKIINDIWEYEIKAFGRKVTEITEEEISIAEKLGRDLIEDDLASEAAEEDTV